jgi:hypothetical protein
MSLSSENSAAFGAPGIPPHWTSSAKEGLGTAYHLVWKRDQRWEGRNWEVKVQ